jgi:hypothetical protein
LKHQGALNQLAISKAIVRTREEIANRNITRMIILMLLVYYFGYLPYTLRLMFKYANLFNQDFMNCFIIFAVIARDLSVGCTIFIYYKCNKEYHKLFIKHLKRFRILVRKLSTFRR